MIDRKTAIESINEVIEKINESKNILAKDYYRIINRYIELKNDYINISLEMTIVEDEESLKNDGFTISSPMSEKFGDKNSSIDLVFEPNQECEIKSFVLMARDKLIEAIKSFTLEVISKFPELEIIQVSVDKFVNALLN